MDEPQIAFGDKIFVYGQFMMEDFCEQHDLVNPEYNTVMGYSAHGGYIVTALQSAHAGACLPGFVMDFLSGPSLTAAAPFSGIWLDVTDLLSLQSPRLSGSRVWMPLKEQSALPIFEN